MEFSKPSPLKMTGNLIENFKIFKQELQIFFDATECHMTKEATQVTILLNLLGSDGLKVYNALKVKNETVCEILNALESYCISRTNEIMEHYLFFTRNQGADEPFENFYTDLKQLIKTCGFDQFEEKLLRIQIVLGISNKDVQTSLLMEDLSLERVVNECRAAEQTENNRKVIQGDNTNLLFNVETSQKPKYGTNSNSQSIQKSNAKSDLGQLIKTSGPDQCDDELLKTQIMPGISNKDEETSLLREDLPLKRVFNRSYGRKKTKNNRKVIQGDNTNLLFNVETSQKPKYGTNSNSQSIQKSNAKSDLGQLIKTSGPDQCDDELLKTQIMPGISNKDEETSLLREDLPLKRVFNRSYGRKKTKNNRKVIQGDNTNLLFNVETSQKPKYGTNSNSQSIQKSNAKSDLGQLIKTSGPDQCDDELLKTQIMPGISNKDEETSLLREDLPLKRVFNRSYGRKKTKNNRKVIQGDNTNLLFNVETSQKPKYGTNSNSQSIQKSNAKSDSKRLKIPVKWSCYTPYSSVVCNIFLPFKTPLDSKYRVPMRHIFKTDMLFLSMAEIKVDLGLWIDLTNSDRYYDPLEVINNNCRYVKLPLAGHGIPPTCKEVESFLDICWDFVNSNPNLYIGVHCTHGHNRTGFLIVAWLIEVLHYTVNNALQEFAAARPPGIIRQSYINELYRRYEVSKMDKTD